MSHPNLALAVKAHPRIDAVAGRARTICAATGARYVYLPATWIGAHISMVPPTVRCGLDPSAPRANATEAAMAAALHAELLAAEHRNDVGWGWLTFDAEGKWAAHMHGFVESPVRLRPIPTPYFGRCPHCGDHARGSSGVIPVYGPGESYGDPVIGPKARNWPGPFACSNCGNGRSPR